MTNPKEPTLTCSEVVERLAKECMPPIGIRGNISAFDREQATAILDSWRERRVQELEKALRNFVKLVSDGVLVRNITEDGDMAKYLRQGYHLLEVLKQADDALANSEQIRKGAKHE